MGRRTSQSKVLAQASSRDRAQQPLRPAPLTRLGTTHGTLGTSPYKSNENGAGQGEMSICPALDCCFKHVLLPRCQTWWGKTMLHGPPIWPSTAISMLLTVVLQLSEISVRARKYLVSCLPSDSSKCSLEVIHLCFICLSAVIFASIILHDPFSTPYWGKQEW